MHPHTNSETSQASSPVPEGKKEGFSMGVGIDILKRYWGYESFRGVQQEIIESILAGKDTLGLMPTGGGKSICFQVPAMALSGLTIVITPLIALMKDQVDHLRRQGINATAVYSGMRHEEIVTVLENCILGRVKLLYISPERISSELFQNKVKRMNVSFITVDEAHCISQWGYDFRPSYLEIARLRSLIQKKSLPILALTATATPPVVDDIQERLGFAEKNVISMSFARENLSYVVRHASDKMAELVHILQAVPHCAIVYVRSRKRCKEIADHLNKNLATTLPEEKEFATYYHAGLEPLVKEKRQEAWQRGDVRVMVATNAFGMGIDKADVRMVIHIDSPNSLEAYFQEAGRAGRDGKRAYAVLLHNGSDDSRLLKRINDTFPPKDFIREVYDQLAYFYQIAAGYGYGETHEFNIDRFCRAYRHYPTHVEAALTILHQAGYIHYESEPDNAPRLRFLLERNELYRLQEGSKNENAVITALLRCYGGLFVDYCYIDETLLANQTGLDRNIVYLTLKALDQKHIVSFIPRRSVPLITFTRSREEGKHIVIPETVYEHRREQLTRNVEAVITYLNNDYQCRSQQLLTYFGEKDSKPCHICDVCLSQQAKTPAESQTAADVKQAILQLLADGQAHPLTAIQQLPFDSPLISQAMRQLLDEEIIYMDAHEVLLKH